MWENKKAGSKKNFHIKKGGRDDNSYNRFSYLCDRSNNFFRTSR